MNRLYRSETERMVGGVLGGLAEYFNVDPTIFRLLFIVSLFLSFGTAFIVYFIAMVIVPNEGDVR